VSIVIVRYVYKIIMLYNLLISNKINTNLGYMEVLFMSINTLLECNG
jgi:hypothetical protein